MPFPFDSSPDIQLAELERGLQTLRQFFDTYPSLPHPWSMSPLAPLVMFSSQAADALRTEFGREGWNQERSIIWRMENGVRVEMQLGQQQPQPFLL